MYTNIRMKKNINYYLYKKNLNQSEIKKKLKLIDLSIFYDL